MTITQESGAQLDVDVWLRVALLHTVSHMYTTLQERYPYRMYVSPELFLNEAWLLVHGFDPKDFEEDCVTVLSDSILMDLIRTSEDREELIAFLVCTLKHLS